MSSAKEARAAAAAAAAGLGPRAGGGERRRSPLDQLPPPASSNKPLTPFSIEDILSKPSPRKAPPGRAAPSPSPPAPAPAPARLPDKAAGGGGAPRAGLPAPSSPLCALEELASKTFKGLELSVLQAAEGRDPLGAFGPRPASKKRRKSRTAFTNHQIYELEKRFLYQKYLSPADRDHLAQQLGLSNAQVITWFQNRRAKLKRDLEEMKADVESLKKLPPAALEQLARLPELGEPRGGPASPPASPGAGSGPGLDPGPDPAARGFSEDDDEEIDVDD
ncbi:transcription factor LBX2 isoform X4 [Alligator mississippiensis]|uniref:transcription factor LBX2 isoform X4 n=1 Tax=Alligator mississippiensis TaxID=8496 RepID=UPI002877D3C0|nr:transcription factor LBX2 isoform X4 [Alligator mississippiensis]